MKVRQDLRLCDFLDTFDTNERPDLIGKILSEHMYKLDSSIENNPLFQTIMNVVL